MMIYCAIDVVQWRARSGRGARFESNCKISKQSGRSADNNDDPRSIYFHMGRRMRATRYANHTLSWYLGAKWAPDHWRAADAMDDLILGATRHINNC